VQGSKGGKAMMPAKDADEKHTCPHCNKTCASAKHLKRHLPRRESLNGWQLRWYIDED
jgi:hypothetical protein